MTRWFPDGMPQPISDNDSLPWWRAAAEHRFTVQRCTDCSHLRLPAAPLCPSCRSFASDWMEVSGRGNLYTYTIVHRPIAPDQTVPFIVAVVELEGAPGVRIISNIVDTPHDELAIGLALSVVWEDMSADLAIPRFRAARS